ncbi:hypothetical protein ACYZUA_15870 [Pseudomonas sp. LS2P72]
MDGKPILLDKFRHQAKHSYSFAIAPSTGGFWPLPARFKALFYVVGIVAKCERRAADVEANIYCFLFLDPKRQLHQGCFKCELVFIHPYENIR